MALTEIEKASRYKKQMEWNDSVITELKKIVEGNRAIFDQIRAIRVIKEAEERTIRSVFSIRTGDDEGSAEIRSNGRVVTEETGYKAGYEAGKEALHNELADPRTGRISE